MIITKEILDNLSEQAKANPRLRQAMDLRNSPEDGSQRMLNALEPGTVIPIHRHQESSETVTIIRGAICEHIYDNNGNNIESITLRYGDTIPILVVPKGTWHNLECLEPDTIIFECKDGRYQPTQEQDILIP
jgi:cupin fold WbuC family metalloprotein